MIITIQAKRGEGIAFTTGKVATMFSNSRNVIVIANKDDIRDRACIVPHAPTIGIEEYEWYNFHNNIENYIREIGNLIESANGMKEQLFLYLMIDGRFVDKKVLENFIDRCSKEFHNIIIPIVMKYL
ncbi:hypothetical protein AL714_13165 [Clostridium botulinum]|uniref:hypothetical protein n=1 Tax=Clostridium botulinum TaxID=1491 RepID=UPI00099BC09D|nr:hypothetical protein [Clostridium botulinum]MCC5440921.1 hypothetical protein [Clostridium botulinum]NFR59079.1 hypothetical protein [Clostridium botulinum]OPD36445.1 hypothetical protein AL714_13165 [Clostridium botulinum]